MLLATLLLATLLLATLPVAADTTQPTVEPAWILARIARPVPSRTDFVELRESKLLKAPLRIIGEYRHPDVATLVREVRSPYAETTTIRAGEAVVERTGKTPRRVSLARVPELAALQASFGALLTGDRAQLEQHYRLHGEGTRQHWRLSLTPTDVAVARRIRGIVLHGRGAELRCIETQPAQGGEVQRTLLAGAARDSRQVLDPAALAALCRGAAAG
ncbi:MAG: LolA-related protein [Luteimonas sp.]